MNTNPPPQRPVSLPLAEQRPFFAELIAEKTILRCDDLKAKAKNLAADPGARSTSPTGASPSPPSSRTLIIPTQTTSPPPFCASSSLCLTWKCLQVGGTSSAPTCAAQKK